MLKRLLHAIGARQNAEPPIPEIFRNLLRAGTWIHPGDDVIHEMIPFFKDPIDFLVTEEMVRLESTSPLARESTFNELEQASQNAQGVTFLDPDDVVCVAVCRYPGDDISIMLDLAMNATDPRVVANDWTTGFPCVWREVAPAFSMFCRTIGV